MSARLNELVETKSKFLFFNVHQYFGIVSENEFTLTRQKFDWWGMMSSRLKGRVFKTVNGEIREADFSLKAMMVLLVFVFPACMIFAIAILPAKLTDRRIVKLLHLRRTR